MSASSNQMISHPGVPGKDSDQTAHLGRFDCLYLADTTKAMFFTTPFDYDWIVSISLIKLMKTEKARA